jgi:nucleoside-diphosphate-sugar epimerase
LITGASSLIARYLVPLLREEGREVVLLSRTRPVYLSGADSRMWLPADLRDADWVSRLDCSFGVLIHLAPLPLLQPTVTALSQAPSGRIIAFGTTSRLTKMQSPSAADQRMVTEQAAAEDWLADFGAAFGVNWSLFRPTLIYDGRHDKNVALIARFITRFGFFPLVGEASGLRQPVHAADLAQACSLALECEATFANTYNLGGGETLSYKAMVDRIFANRAKKPRYARIPPTLLKAGLNLARLVPKYRYLNGAMAERMSKNMVFDYSDAVRDFGYRPRKFATCSPD